MRGVHAAASHDGPQQWGAGQIGLIRLSDDIAGERTVVRSRAPDLFAIRIGRLVSAQFHLRRHPSVEIDFDQLVNASERRRVARSREIGADAEKIDRRSSRYQAGDLELVQVATGENLRPAHSRIVKYRPYLFR